MTNLAKWSTGSVTGASAQQTPYWYNADEVEKEFEFLENAVMGAATILGATIKKLAAANARVGELEQAIHTVVLNGRGRSGGSVYMVNKEQWNELKSALTPPEPKP